MYAHTPAYTHAHVHVHARTRTRTAYINRSAIRVRVCAWCTPRRRGGHVCACERSRSPFPSLSLSLHALLSFGGGGRRAVILRHHHRRRRRRPARSTRSIAASRRPGDPPTENSVAFSPRVSDDPPTHCLARHSVRRGLFTHMRTSVTWACVLCVPPFDIIYYCNNS